MYQLSIFDEFVELNSESVPAQVSQVTPVAKAVVQASKPARAPEFFRLTEEHLEGLTGQAAKLAANLAAIETAIECRKARKQPTDEQRRTMAAYTGWGGLSEVFAPNSQFAKAQKRLKELLSQSEYAQAQDSVLTAYYTEPSVIKAMWQMVRSAGFTGGAVLEPSCGNGHFIGCMPDDLRQNSHVQMVEIEPLTAAMASAIYSDSKTLVRNSGIEDCQQSSAFDLVIGNVPFGNYRVSDRRLDRLKLPIHEYFVAKALDMVRPGGLVALIVSASLIDKKLSSLKPLMLQKADLLSVVRLPSGVFSRLGGTDVLTDILLLQKRVSLVDEEKLPELLQHPIMGTALAHRELCDATDYRWTGPAVSKYFVANPANVLGKFSAQRSRYGENIGVRAAPDWLDRLQKLAAAVPPVFDPASNVGEFQLGRSRAQDPLGLKSMVSQGFFFAEDGQLMLVNDRNEVEPQDHLPATTLGRLEGMTRIRDCVLRLLEADAGRKPQADEFRKELNALYDGFVNRHGYLLSMVNRRLFRVDSHAPLLWSLEFWDDENEQGVKADVFTSSTVSSSTLPTSAETVDDAVALSYNKMGRMDVAVVAEALGRDVEDVAAELLDAGRVFMDPETGNVVDALEYLSGNVRLKLKAAKAAAANNPVFEPNVAALAGVQPAWVALSDVSIRLGVPWIPAQVIKQWLEDCIGVGKGDLEWVTAEVVHVPETASWNVSCPAEKAAIFKSEWGTARKGFWDLLQLLLNQQAPEVYDEIELEDGKTRRVINRDETLAAQAKAEMISESFVKWLMAQADIVQGLEQTYNERYNGTVNRRYDGSHLSIPGLNPQIKLRDAQKDAIWRGIVSGNTLYALAVGGGKTLIQICLAQESKRLGIANKPVLVVPNHMLEAFAGEYLRAFPRAKVLAASKDDFDGEKRKTLLMRVATGNWDCIIVTHSTFGRIGLDKQTIRKHANSIKERAREAVLGTTDKNVVREAARIGKSVEAKLETLTTVSRDSGLLAFEDLGIDMILVDEADLYKNLFFFTKKKRIPGINSAFSGRALDLFIKSRVVFERRADKSRGLMFSTATPISNSIAEMFIMQTYLQEARLQALDIDNFDAWSANFAREVTCVEVKPEGSGYRLHTRFARFVNVPELMLIFREIAEVRTKKMLGLPEPKLHGGSHEVVAVAPSEQQKAFVKKLVERAEAIRNGLVTPDVDNMLCVTGDGRKAALDMRCVDTLAKDDPGSKVNACVAKVFEIWQASQEQRLTQLVFCDLSVPSKIGFSVYQHIRESLVKLGVPEGEIAFAQDWDTDAKKGRLHRMVRAGQIRILIGSTELMGFGTNVQDRLVAKHDLDAPWRPRDVEQRDGRIIRQGNLNEIVHIYRYVTEGTFDAYMWQTLERKAQFIAQVMDNEGQARSVEDVTSQALSYAEVKALASGNPIVIEKAAVDAEVARLEAIKFVHEDDVRSYLRKANEAQSYAQYLKQSLGELQSFQEKARWEIQQLKVCGVPFADLASAGKAIMDTNQRINELVKREKNRSINQVYELLEVGNLTMQWKVNGSRRDLVIGLTDKSSRFYTIDSMPYGAEKIAQWLRDGGPVAELAKNVQELEVRIDKQQTEAKTYAEAATRVFEHGERLERALQRQAEIDAELEIDVDDKSALALSQE